MALRLSCLSLSRRIPNCVSVTAYFSSQSCAMNLQSTLEFDQSQSNSSDYEAKIQFLKNKLHPDSLVSVLDITPDLNSSIMLFKWASLQKRFTHTADTYQMMILKLGMAGNVEEMEGFCNEMVRQKFCGFDMSLLALIHSFVSNHRLSEALRVLYVMNSSSFKPTIGIFNALMGALVVGKRDFKDVLFVYKELVKAGIAPNIDTLNYLLEALFESERVDTAVDQYRRLDRKGCKPNIKTFQIVVSGLAVRNRVEESVVILEEMFHCNCEPDSSFYTCIIPIFCSLHNLEMGKKLFKMMRDSTIAPDSITYGAMIRCLCEHLQMNDAIELFEEMVDSSLLPDRQVFMDFIKGLCKLNRLAEARKFLEESDITDNFLEESDIMDSSFHNVLLGSYCDSGNFVMAEVVFDEMSERNITDAESWNIIIRNLCENARVKKALQYLCRMVVSSFDPDSATYCALLLGYCKMGKAECALELFCHIRSKCWVLDLVSYAGFVECLCQMGRIQEAADVFLYMSDKGCGLKATSFSLLIEKICAIGEVNRAIKLLSLASYDDTSSLCAAYNSILRGLFSSGKEKYSLTILSQMIVAGCAFGVETYCILLRCMISLIRKGDCISVFNLMLSEDLVPDSETLAYFLSYLTKNSQLHLIIPSIDKLISKFENPDSTMYNVLIDSLWREGYRIEASHLLDLMLEKGWVPDASTHALLMGSSEKNEVVGRKSAKENFDIHDNVNSILDEGLGEM